MSRSAVLRAGWNDAGSVSSPTSLQPLMRNQPVRIRAGSSRNPAEARCQNPDCAAVLDVTSIPVEYEAILRQMLESAAADEASFTVAPDTADDTAAASSLEKGQVSSTGNGSLATSLAGAMASFKESAKRGDSVSFAVLVAEICSGPSGVDLPLCDGCMEDTLRARTKANIAAGASRDSAYHALAVLQAHLQQHTPSLSHSPIATTGAAHKQSQRGDNITTVSKKLAEQEAALLAEIEAAQHRIDAARLAKQALQRKKASLDGITSDLWLESKELARSLQGGKDRLYALVQREDRYRDLLSKLRRLSVHSDAFFVWHRGPFVTINSARIGRLPGLAVEWTEVNAALGQLAFLLSSTAARLGFIFSSGDERTAFELFYDGSFFATSRLNNALKALAVCMGELGGWAERTDRSFCLPYAITGDGSKVGDLAVTMGKDIPWTRAMKLLATNLKWIVAWAFKQQSQPMPLVGAA